MRGKCDEARPSCSPCRRGGRACPGYARERKFVDEGPRLRQRPTRNANLRIPSRSSVKNSDSTPSGSIATVTLAPNGKCDVDNPSVCEWHPGGQCDTRWHHICTSRLDRDQLVSSFVSTMFPLGVASVQSSLLGSWLWHVPPRLGCSAALDHAALSLALAYFAHGSSDRALLPNAESSYTLALKCLAMAISNTSTRFDSDVLCATLLLGCYEVRILPVVRYCRAAAHLCILLDIYTRKTRLDRACGRCGTSNAATGCSTMLRIPI
jgi:hypothetical protein